VREWIAKTDLPSALLESAYRLDKAFGTDVSIVSEGNANLLTQDAGSAALLDQLAAIVPPAVKGITVVGAFFDFEGRFVTELLIRWPSARVVIGVEPDTVCLSRLPEDSRVRVVDATSLGGASHDGYLHAKAVYFEGVEGDAVFASGSANPSAPAWLTDGATVNTEAMVVRTGDAARNCAAEIGMDRLVSMPTLSKEKLSGIMDRTRAELDQPQSDPVPVLVGIADHASQAVTVEAPRLPAFNRLLAFDSMDQPLQTGLDWSVPGTLRITGDLLQVRSLSLQRDDAVVARVLVHHPAIIDHQIKAADQGHTMDLLRALGSEIGDISRVLPALERVIFSSGMSDALRIPGRRTTPEIQAAAIARPETLCVSLTKAERQLGTSLFATSHDLAYLIEILTTRIDLVPSASARDVDRSGCSEEEQIGRDDEEDLLPEPDMKLFNDRDVGNAMCRRISKLCRRMAQALKGNQPSYETVARLVVQLVAVLALLHELARLQLLDRWRNPGIDLFHSEDLGGVLGAAMERLFVSEGGVDLLCDHEAPSEVVYLVGLMLWGAWLVGYEWWSPHGRDLNTGEHEELIALNARLVRLLTFAGDHDVWNVVRSHIERSILPTPLKLRNATRWLDRHIGISRELVASLASLPDISRTCGPIAAGDIVDVPDVIDRLLVATSTDGNYVRVASGGLGRVFTAARVRLRARV
jgi:hypothetical protein